MVQLSYPLNPGIALAGIFADMGQNDVVTMNNPAVQLPFGQAVEKITADEDGVKLPDNGAPVFWGIALKDVTEETDYYPVKSAVGVVRKGRMYVPVEDAVTPDDAVFVRYNGVAQVQTITLDADIIAANVFTVTVDGNVLTETYAASHDATMAAMTAQILAQPSVATSTCPGAGSRIITVTSVIGVSIAVTVLTDEGITLGVTQANVVVAETTAGIAYDQRGKFRTDVDGGTAVAWTAAAFIKGAAAAGLAVIEINLP